jgi:hypothetical protein
MEFVSCRPPGPTSYSGLKYQKTKGNHLILSLGDESPSAYQNTLIEIR